MIRTDEPFHKNQFLEEVTQDLRRSPKRLNSKYFYDKTGDALFQRIMACPDYYLTRCETEIFDAHAPAIAELLDVSGESFDLIELGAGDASKTIRLLNALTARKSRFNYVPIDISSSIIEFLKLKLGELFPDMNVQGLNGEYLDMLNKVHESSDRRKVLLFLGSTIGNMEPPRALQFCKELRARLDPGDRMLIGFDLKKHPARILAAYNDAAGLTKQFNLNLLVRINRELGGDFDLDQFDHYPVYHPETGAAESFLVSIKDQSVHIGESLFFFRKDEVIHMEISQKYDLPSIENMALEAGFQMIAAIKDSRNWFVDAIWECTG